MNEIIDNIRTRRSCKSYCSDPLPGEIVDQIVEAGLFAASGGGMQTPIVLVAEKEARDRLSRLNAKYDPKKRTDPFYNAPVPSLPSAYERLWLKNMLQDKTAAFLLPDALRTLWASAAVGFIGQRKSLTMRKENRS